MPTETEQVTRVIEALFEGENAEEVTIGAEAYEGSVAVHVRKPADVDGFPALSIYLSPADAIIHAERMMVAARLAIKDPSYSP